jgi:V/A-type H+-transporting ATPase subunit E
MPKSRTNRDDNPARVASGVEELIARLRDQGVAAGRDQADKLVADARSQAQRTLDQARQQADQIVKDARQEAETLESSGKQALELALRDAVLALKSQLMERFRGEVRQLVGEEQQKQEILEKMILEVVGRVREQADRSENTTVILPRQVAGLEELSQNPEELENGVLTRFVQLVSRGMLREGVSFGVAADPQMGLRLRLVDRDVVLDLSDEAVSETILQHLQPRFRALLEGVVK